MSLAIVYTRAALGIEAPLITVEVHLSNGLPGLTMVGLPETTVKEARDRVRSALINSGYAFPAKKITINLAPADRFAHFLRGRHRFRRLSPRRLLGMNATKICSMLSASSRANERWRLWPPVVTICS